MKQIKATLYKIDGSFEPLILESKTSLETLQKLVGGYIEIIHLVDIIESLKSNCISEKDLVINEEGLLLDLPINPWSSHVAINTIWQFEEFRGDIILVEGRLP
jgi:Domain of unknown function (DUF3846)